ncbi:hypothetical protein AA0113_g12278 [Alternaria arborescens]|uniref:Uncharacterized protein n=1 Tax=Alternaria arborescens TaxID=156630 RepID=A0A4Q4PXT7_9PLEO|nr:hypothetical protein AA0113_g12278 [Alternaria arborescens]
MSQQGGAYHASGSLLSYQIRLGNRTLGSKPMSKEAHDTNVSEPKTDDQRSDNEKELGEEWEVVEWPVVDDKEEHGPCDGCRTYRRVYHEALKCGNNNTLLSTISTATKKIVQRLPPKLLLGQDEGKNISAQLRLLSLVTNRSHDHLIIISNKPNHINYTLNSAVMSIQPTEFFSFPFFFLFLLFFATSPDS